MKRIFLLVVGAFIALVAMKAVAQPCPLLKGSVIDQKTGEPLPGANVRILQSIPEGTGTDTHGYFELKVTYGDTIIISFIGYKEKKMAVPDDCSLTVRLVPTSTGLGDVVIQSERLIAEEFTIKKINKLEVYTNPGAKADPILAVNSTPSATTIDESANISLRGGSPAETGIFLNNVPINDAVRYSQLNGIGTFSIFNTALVNSVLVYPGNPPLEFGNTTSGLIALQTDEVIPSKPVNTLSVTLASMGLYTQRKLSDRSSLTAFSNYQPSTFIRLLNPEAMKKVTAFSSIDLGIHYYLRINDRTVLKVFNYGIRESYKYHYSQPTYAGDFVQNKVRNFTVGNLRHRFEKSEISFNNAISFSSARYSLSTITIDLRLSDFYSSVNYQYFGNKAEIKSGLSYDFKSSTFNGKYPRYAYALGEQFPVDSSQSSQSVKLPEVYFYLKYFLAPKWVLGTGMRKNIALESQKDFLSTQINLNYKPTKELSLNLAGGRYNKFQLPQGQTAEPFHIAADQYSFDVNWKKSGFENSLSAFHKKSRYEQTEATVKGIELFTKYRLNANLRGQLSLTCLDANLTREGQPLVSPYDIGYFFRGNLEYKFDGTWTVTAVFLFRQGSYYTPVTSTSFDPTLGVYIPYYDSPQRLPAYQLIDVNVSKLFMVKEKFSSVAFAGLGNIMNFKNVRGYTYNFDYSSTQEELFSQRTLYFGWILNF